LNANGSKGAATQEGEITQSKSFSRANIGIPTSNQISQKK
jgi:hypothetical protein